MKATEFIVIMVLLSGMFLFCIGAMSQNVKPSSARPQIVIIGAVEELTFHDRKVWYVDYMIDGYQQGVSLYNEYDVQPFIDKLFEVGDVSFLRE